VGEIASAGAWIDENGAAAGAIEAKLLEITLGR